MPCQKLRKLLRWPVKVKSATRFRKMAPSTYCDDEETVTRIILIYKSYLFEHCRVDSVVGCFWILIFLKIIKIKVVENIDYNNMPKIINFPRRALGVVALSAPMKRIYSALFWSGKDNLKWHNTFNQVLIFSHDIEQKILTLRTTFKLTLLVPGHRLSKQPSSALRQEHAEASGWPRPVLYG